MLSSTAKGFHKIKKESSVNFKTNQEGFSNKKNDHMARNTAKLSYIIKKLDIQWYLGGSVG